MSCVTIKGLEKTIAGLKAAGANLPQIVDNALGDSAKDLRDKVKQRITDIEAVDTGRLRDNISARRNAECQWSVGTNVEYAAFIEFGTGLAGDPAVPHTAKPKWVYFSPSKNEFRTAYPQKARPFMRPTFAENKPIIIKNVQKAIIEAAINARKGG